jgi:hypothetical protein
LELGSIGSIGIEIESTDVDAFDNRESSVHMERQDIVGAGGVPSVDLLGLGHFEYHLLFFDTIKVRREC